MKRTIIFLACAALACAADSALAQGFRNRTPALTVEAKNALVEALAGEHGEHANLAEYKAVLAKFGPEVLPYANLLEAEKRHVAALEQQCRKFGVPLPPAIDVIQISPEATLLDIAEDAIEAEAKNVAMYERLLPSVQDYPSLVQVFSNLQAASRDRHIPALQAAKENGGSLAAGTCPQAGIRRQQRPEGCDQSGIGWRQRGETCPQQRLNCPGQQTWPQGLGGQQQRRRGNW